MGKPRKDADLARGRRIKERREAIGLSQQAVASALRPGMPASTVQRWEQGAAIRDVSIDDLAGVLQTSTTHLLVGGAPSAIATPSAPRSAPTLVRQPPPPDYDPVHVHGKREPTREQYAAVNALMKEKSIPTEHLEKLEEFSMKFSGLDGHESLKDDLWMMYLGWRRSVEGGLPSPHEVKRAEAQAAAKIELEKKKAEIESRGIVVQRKPSKKGR